jgi:hypothetical protein
VSQNAAAVAWQSSARDEDRSRAINVVPVAVSFDLSPDVAVDFVVTVSASGRDSRRVPVRVEFPNETRSFLELLSWTGGCGIACVLERMGAAAIGRAIETALAGADDQRAPAALPLPSRVRIFEAELRAGLASVGVDATVRKAKGLRLLTPPAPVP